jgi:hypothetical protein
MVEARKQLDLKPPFARYLGVVKPRMEDKDA